MYSKKSFEKFSHSLYYISEIPFSKLGLFWPLEWCYPLRGLPTLPIPKRPEPNGDRLLWMKMSIMKQQKAYCMVQESLIKCR